MGLVLFLLLVILGLRFPRSAKTTWAILAFMLLFFSFVPRDGDYQQYKYVYEQFDSGWLTAYEPGFIAIVWLCKTLLLPYSLFRLCVGTLFLLGLYRAIKAQTENTAFSLALILVFPFFCFVAVIRSALAMAVVLNVLPFLLEGSLKSAAKYTAGIALAALFHYSSLFFLPLLLVRFQMNWKRAALFGAISLTFGVLLYFTDWIYKLLSLVTQNPKVLGWFTDNASKANLTGAAAILSLFLAFCFSSRIASATTIANKKQQAYAALTAKMGVLLLFAFPLFAYSSVFTRQLYILLPCVIITCANAACSGTVFQRKPFLAALGTVLLFAFYYDLPYLKQGLSMFDELLSFPKFW